MAGQTVAALRADGDPHDPATAALVAELHGQREFRELWARHDVQPTRDETKRFTHPVVGDLTLRRQTLTVAGSGVVVIAYQAEPGSPSADGLARLL